MKHSEKNVRSGDNALTVDKANWISVSRMAQIEKDWKTSRKFFIMSTEFDKNISDGGHDCTDHKNGFDFFMRLVVRPKIAVKKCQILIFKVNFQHQKSSETF